MKLDKRVKENALIGHCFNAEELKRYIGQVCYFTDTLEDFSDLINPFEGVLKAVSPDAVDCYVAEAKVNGGPVEFSYAFCLPAVFVEEKPEEKFIPFRYLNELTDAGIEVGKVISIRNKNDDIVVAKVLVTEINYNHEDMEVINITLGATGYEFPTLFNSYLLQVNGEWKPFGVEG